MTGKRQGRAGFFKGASLARHAQPAADPQAALAALSATVYDWDIGTDTLTWGPNAGAALGLPPDALPRSGQAYAALVEPDGGLSDRLAAVTQLGAETTYELRYALRFGNDQVLMVQDSGRIEVDGEGRPRHARGLLRADQAAGDLLPGAIRLRSSLLARLNGNIAEALRFSHSITLIVGRVAGEEDAPDLDLLAHYFRPMMRRRDSLSALGTDRFALVLASCAAWDAMSAMKRLAGLAAEHDVQVQLGAASAPDHALEATDLLRHAEQALHEASIGNEAVVLYRPQRHSPSPATKTGTDPLDLVHALNDRRIALALQPAIDAQTRNAVFSQAHASLTPETGGRDSILGHVPPLKGTNLPLLVAGRLLELTADHLSRQPDARVSLAIAPAALRDAEWSTMLAAHLGARPGIESRLLIEVPERILRYPGGTRGRLDAMKALGVGIVLSGFGSGYASLAQLRHLPIDLLKIDGAFTQVLGRSTDERLFLRRLIDIAQHLGIGTVADGVSDEGSAQKLAEWGVDYLQGPLAGDVEALALPGLTPLRVRRA
ncbi:EAL domain-containing protein [Microvirga puerhi]|uniref:GGDEF domain-containing phosphodiesterase n=1 Tax=Microvirga puerhi TaxID=2876078 RepID=A0ABS7VQ38_9HYPH|nr:GGDEF domain-containing phosphodiesterase [Microvirga puerhi]MBZ6077639.1 GGDEF domain-containing phosphodiesterase [Microvirga puerhi]